MTIDIIVLVSLVPLFIFDTIPFHTFMVIKTRKNIIFYNTFYKMY